MISVIRDLVMAACLFIAIANGGNQLLGKILYEVKKAALTKVSKGLTPLSIITRELTAKKLRSKL